MTEYASFRQRLDAVLRTRDVEQVRAFMIGEDQWSLDAPADREFAMWMMIAGTSTLKEMHAEARSWLVEHGHAEEAEALLHRSQSRPQQGKTSPGKTPQKKQSPGKSSI